MKNIILALCLITFSFSLVGQNVLTYQPNQDTITNTAADTLTFSFPNNSYTYAWQLNVIAGISGTDSLTLIIEESASPTSTTSWKQVGSTVTIGGTSSANRTVYTNGTVYGLRQRAIITGKATQSTSYRLWGVFKRP